MTWIKYHVVRILRWIVIRLSVKLGFQTVNSEEYRLGLAQMVRLAVYVEKSGALSHPKRIKARKEIRNGIRETLSMLAVGEYRTALDAGKVQRDRNLQKEAVAR